MKPAFDLTSVRLLLRQGIAKGHWTLEDLDTPSMGFRENAKQFRLHYPKYEQYEYRNLLREPDPAEEVQVSDPRDFTPAIGATPAQTLDLPLTTEDPLDDLPF
jgi:hypothetical protein